MSRQPNPVPPLSPRLAEIAARVHAELAAQDAANPYRDAGWTSERLGITRAKLYHLVSSGEIRPCYKKQQRLWFSVEEVERVAAERKSRQA